MRVDGYVLNNISLSIIIPSMLLPAIFYQHKQASFGNCEHQWVE